MFDIIHIITSIFYRSGARPLISKTLAFSESGNKFLDLIKELR